MELVELKHKIEALLFSSAKKMTIPEIAALSRSDPNQVQNALESLEQDYGEKNSSLVILREDDYWKIAVKEKHLDLVRKVVSQTELTKTMMETLATIAWKAPCLQSDIIKIRTNKAYDHVHELEKNGFITRTKKGRSQLIRLGSKFYDYFDIPSEKIKEVFGKFDSLETQIEEKESEAKIAREKVKAIEEEHKKQREAMEQIGGEVLNLDEELTEAERVAAEMIQEEDQESLKGQKIENVEEKVGNLDVVDLPPEPPKPVEETNEAQDDFEEEMTDEKAEERVNRPLPEHIEKKVATRVQELVEQEGDEAKPSEEDDEGKEGGEEENSNSGDSAQFQEESSEESSSEESSGEEKQISEESDLSSAENSEESTEHEPLSDESKNKSPEESIQNEIDKKVDEMMHPK